VKSNNQDLCVTIRFETDPVMLVIATSASNVSAIYSVGTGTLATLNFENNS
jgi:hypothetical protein